MIKSTVGSTGEQINGNDGIMPERNPAVCSVLVARSWGLKAAGAEPALVLPVTALRDGLIDGMGSAAQQGERCGAMPEPSTGTSAACEV